MGSCPSIFSALSVELDGRKKRNGTGRIRMPLLGRRAGMVSVGDTVLVEGAWVKEYSGELQLRVGKDHSEKGELRRDS